MRSSLRDVALALVLLLAGCSGDRLEPGAGDIDVSPKEVRVQGWVGHQSDFALKLVNRSQVPVTAYLEVDVPFQVEPVAELAGGEVKEVRVSFLPQHAGSYERVLGVAVGEREFDVQIHGHAADVPECLPAGSCMQSEFDYRTGICEQHALADGIPCAQPCIVDGRCGGGVCLGKARSCDDGDACTADACAPEGGCAHAALSCPASENPCLAASCASDAGCVYSAAPDGMACGEVECGLASVCVQGQCVTRKAPPEMASATLCASKVVAGDDFSCALLEDGDVACWGRPPGEVRWRKCYQKAGPTDLSPAPYRIPLPARATNLWARFDSACVRLVDDSVWCWGLSTDGEDFGSAERNVSRPVVYQYYPQPIHAPDFDGALTLTGGREGICAVVEDGGVRCTGQFDWWPPDAKEIVEVADAVDVGGSWPDWYAVRPDGTVWGWGVMRLPPNDGNTIYTTAPFRNPFDLQLPVAARFVESSLWSSCAVLVDGRVACWGWDFEGRAEGPFRSPRILSTLSGVTDLDLGISHACAVIDGGLVSCWGDNWGGQLGIPPPNGTQTPNTLPIANVIGVAAGYRHSCALDAHGIIRCWGSNEWGQCGVGASSDGGIPTVVLPPAKVRWNP